MRRHATYSNVVASIALLLSMSGGALAATHYVVTSASQIKPSVRQSLKSEHLSALLKEAPSLIVLPPGQQGPYGPTGAQGAQGPRGFDGVQGPQGPPMGAFEQRVARSTKLLAGTTALEAECPKGSNVTGGGAELAPPGVGSVVQSGPLYVPNESPEPQGWKAEANAAKPPNESFLIVIALCAPE